jgi:hypothetical protein
LQSTSFDLAFPPRRTKPWRSVAVIDVVSDHLSAEQVHADVSCNQTAAVHE